MVLPPSATMRTAIELKNAIDNASKHLEPIGFCPTLSDHWHGESESYALKKKPGQTDHKVLIKELSEIKKEYNARFYIGALDTPFSLTVTRKKCEFTGDIVPVNGDKHKLSPESSPQIRLVKKWFEGGAISEKDTNVGPSVNNPREIPAAEFTVAPELLDSVQKHWAAHLLPTHVRVEPYKILLHGPGDRSPERRDTPEKGQVGTFLVGLGDSTTWCWGDLLAKGGDESAKAHSGIWVAFYPDVKYEVRGTVRGTVDGYRAVMVFKIFRLPSKVDDLTKSATQAKTQVVMNKMPMKYGLLLERQYCKGTTELSGFDAQLFAAAKARMGFETHILPVLIKFDGIKHNGMYWEEGSDNDSSRANVFPFMEPHIDALVTLYANSPSDSISDDEDEVEVNDEWQEDEDEDGQSHQTNEPLELSLKGTEAAWIKERNVSEVPFYSPDLPNSLIIWRRKKEDSDDIDGVTPSTEDSIYLSYAMVVLPKIRQKKRKRGEDE